MQADEVAVIEGDMEDVEVEVVVTVGDMEDVEVEVEEVSSVSVLSPLTNIGKTQ